MHRAPLVSVSFTVTVNHSRIRSLRVLPLKFVRSYTVLSVCGLRTLLDVLWIFELGCDRDVHHVVTAPVAVTAWRRVSLPDTV